MLVHTAVFVTQLMEHQLEEEMVPHGGIDPTTHRSMSGRITAELFHAPLDTDKQMTLTLFRKSSFIPRTHLVEPF